MRDKIREMLEFRLGKRVGDASLLIVGDDNCPNCGAIKELLSDELDKGEAKYYNAESIVGKFWIKLFDADYIPFVIYMDKETGKAHRVSVIDEGEEVLLEVTDDTR